MIVAIAGGGLAGLTLAGALQAQGVDALVLERQPEVRDTGAGISLWPNALAALDAASLGDVVRSLGRKLAGPALLAVAPIAGYRAGQRAVNGTRPGTARR